MLEKMTNRNTVLLMGGIIVDRYFEVEKYPEPGQDTSITASFEKIGGCALNVAITLKNLGSLPYIVSRVGDDEPGRRIDQYMKSASLSASCISFSPKGQTGYCLTMIDGSGERTFFTHRGCEGDFEPAMLPPGLPKKADYAYITGYYLLKKETAAAVLQVVEQLRGNGCRIVFDPGPLAGNIEVSQLQKMISLSHWMIPNRDELDIIEKIFELNVNPIQWLQGQGCNYIAVKKGGAGVDVYAGSNTISRGGFHVKSVDTTGAGDSFAGGLIHALGSDFKLNAAIELASACGAFTTTIGGPHGHFSLKDINHFISTHKGNLNIA